MIRDELLDISWEEWRMGIEDFVLFTENMEGCFLANVSMSFFSLPQNTKYG